MRWRTPATLAVGMIVVTTVTSVGRRALDGEDPPSWMRSPAAEEPALPAAPVASSPLDLEVEGGDHKHSSSRARPARAGTMPSEAVASPPPATSSPTTTAPPPPSPPPIVARPVPQPGPVEPPPSGPPPPWADSTRRTSAGHLATDVGCAGGTGAGSLDPFFAGRRGPALGLDYQHVYPLGGGRSLWLFQDAFLDHSGAAIRLDQASFAHNVAMVQQGDCFTLLHRGTADAPTSFEPGTGEQSLRTWFWPMGGELVGDTLYVFWAQMRKVADPGPGDGLGWDPASTWLATYDAGSLARTSFAPAPSSGVDPIYGYAVASDDHHTYLFGNTFDQNLADQGGFFGGPHSARLMYLARVGRGHLGASPEYWTGAGWSGLRTDAVPISDRFSPENPMQARYLDGQWVAVTKVGGYWGEELAIDVAAQPWGPWETVVRRQLPPRGGDPLMNTYHAHLMPWLSGGSLVISVSQNARDMLAHAWPHPERYRPQFVSGPLVRAPVRPPPPTTTPSTTTTSTTSTTTTSTSMPSTTTSPTPPTSTPSSTSTTSMSTSSTSSTTTIAPPTTPAPCPTSTTSTAPTATTDPAATTTTTTTTAPCGPG